MNTYDEGKDGEETSIHTRGKIGSENKNKVFTEKEKADYLNNLRNKYKDQKSIEQQFAEAKLVPEKDKENWYDEKTHNEYKYKVTFTKNETKYLTKKYKISEKELRKNPTKYIYYDSLDKNNRVFEDKKEFEKFQNELKEKIKNEKYSKKRKELEKQRFYKLEDEASVFHNIKLDKDNKPYIDTTFPNEKYVNNVGQEAVFNKGTGKWVNDGINNATYNVGVGELNFNIGRDYAVHLLGSRSDVGLWEDYGASLNDTLTREQRKAISKLGKKYFFNSEFRDFSNRMGKISEEKYQEYLDAQKKKEEDYQNHLYKKYKERGGDE